MPGFHAHEDFVHILCSSHHLMPGPSPSPSAITCYWSTSLTSMSPAAVSQQLSFQSLPIYAPPNPPLHSLPSIAFHTHSTSPHKQDKRIVCNVCVCVCVYYMVRINNVPCVHGIICNSSTTAAAATIHIHTMFIKQTTFTLK